MQARTTLQTRSSSPDWEYTPPNSGILSYLPTKVVPFGELTRIDKPVGVLYLYTQCASGTLLAASLSDPLITPRRLVATNVILLISSILFRGAACSWNDAADQSIDKNVVRTRLRPIARGAISTTAAHVCTGSLLLVAMAFQSQLPRLIGQSNNRFPVYYSIPFIVAAGIYPFLKRFTHYPQLLLGFMNSWGIVVAFPSLGLDLFTSETRAVAASWMIVSVISWTALNDTIYAHQDLNDDLKAGVKSMAVRHRNHVKRLFEGLAGIQVLALLLVAFVIEAGVVYYIGVLFVSGLLSVVIKNVDLDDPQSCAWWFQCGCHLVGVATVCSFLSEYIARG